MCMFVVIVLFVMLGLSGWSVTVMDFAPASALMSEGSAVPAPSSRIVLEWTLNGLELVYSLLVELEAVSIRSAAITAAFQR